MTAGDARRGRLSRAEAKARTRQRLLDAAAAAFARSGYAGASVEEIAEDAGYSIGALYSNFGSKQELFLALMNERAASRVQGTAQVLARGDPAEATWAALGQQMADVADKDIDLAPLQAEFWLYAVRHPEVMDAFSARLRERREPLTALIAEGLGQEGTPYPAGLADRLAIVVSALFQGMVRQRRIDPGNVPPRLYADALRWLFTGMHACEGGASGERRQT